MEIKHIDCKGGWCSTELIKLNRALKTMESGELMEIEATEPSFIGDLKTWNNMMGNTIVSIEPGDIIKVILRKE